jgi:lipoprotein-anchoring transpeptidase ErfK/SrfK
VQRWLPAVAACALLGVVIAAGVAGGSGGDGGDEVAVGDGQLVPSDITFETTPPTVAPPEPVVTVATSVPVEKVPLSRALSNGVAGEDVRRVQERLTELGFVLGAADGVYGPLTVQAVWAFEKLVMETPRAQATGRVTPEMWDRMQDPIAIQPRRPNPGTERHTEIYLPEQVMAVFRGTEAIYVAHISSGDNEEWCEEVTISPGELGNERGTEPLKRGECGRSVTPGGVFQYHRRVEGRRESALGGMLNPVYFNYGIAVHGAQNVPLEPASHGCIRVANDISRQFYDTVKLGDLVYVWDGVKEPEHYGQQLPVFNWIDPDYTTTTSSTSTTSTTTTTTTTTVAPTTTTTSTAPPTTTTTAAPTPAATTTTVAAAPPDPDADG